MLARKGVLVSSPDVQRMTPTQWAYEYYIIKKMEAEKIELIVKIAKAILVNILGLNLLRPTNEHGVPKSYDEMTQEEKDSFMPLVAWVAHPELLKTVKEQFEFEKHCESAMSDVSKEYEDLVARIDENPYDMDAILGIDPEETAERASKLQAQLFEEKLKSLDIKDISEASINIEDL